MLDDVEDEDENESEDTDEFTLTCDNCGEEYTPDDARTIAIFGPGEVRYTCPRCGHGTNGPSPLINKE